MENLQGMGHLSFSLYMLFDPLLGTGQKVSVGRRFALLLSVFCFVLVAIGWALAFALLFSSGVF